MAEPAYDLERYAPARQREHTRTTAETARRLKESKQQTAAKQARRLQYSRMFRLLLAVAVVVALVCGVLYTQTRLTEISDDIADAEYELKEERSLNAYLTFELDNMTSLKNIEDKAAEQGLEKIDNDQITYYRVEDNNGIKLRDDPLTAFFEMIKEAVAGLFGGPQPD